MLFKSKIRSEKLMTKSAFLRQLFNSCKRAFQLPLPASKFNQQCEIKLQYQKIKHKDILTLDEAAFYVGTNPATLLEEVICGHIPGGQLAEQWHFSKSALSEHFSIYHTDIAVCFDDEEIYYQSGKEFSNFEAIRNLFQGYARGERNFSGINLVGAPMSGVNLPYVDFSQSILAAIDLQSSNLQGTDFRYANLREANLHSVNLSYADLRGADLSDANLSHAILVGAKLYGAFITGTNLTGANLRDTLLD